MIIKAKKTTTSIMTPATLIALRTLSGHLAHTNSDVDSYFLLSTMPHWYHNSPSYPSFHFIGLLLSGSNPPKHASLLNQLTILDELVDLLQNPLSTTMRAPPNQTASGIQGNHCVDFQSKE